MSIKLSKPYKIAATRLKRYESHYQLPASQALVIPLKQLGEEVSCDVRWQDEQGIPHFLQNKIFVNDSLVPLNPLIETELYELWQHYYDVKEPQA